MSNVGRPTVIDSATVQKLEAAFRDGFSVSAACYLSGISRSTYYDHCEHNEDFSDKMNVAKQWVTEQAKKVVVQAINKGDLPTAKWWLERRAKDEFSREANNDREAELDKQIKRYERMITDFMDNPDNLPEDDDVDASN